MPEAPTPPIRYWVKNETGRIWGPFGLASIGRLDLGTGDLNSRLQISTDGQTFRPIGEHPEVLKAIEVARANVPVRRLMKVIPASDRPPPPPPPPRAPAPPPPEEVKGPPPSGELQRVSTLELYSRAAWQQLTGKLTLHIGAGDTAIFFKKGTPERVEAPQAAGELAKFLIRRQVAPEAELQAALDMTGGPEGELVDGLYALGIVPPQDVFRLLGEHFVEQLERTLALTVGDFTWEVGVAPPAGSFPLGQKWALLGEFVRRQPGGVVRQRLGDRLRRTVYRSSGARATLDELRLAPQEARVASLLDGTRTPDQLALDMPGETETVTRTTWLLGEVGYLSFGELRAPTGGHVRPADDDAPAVEKVSAHDDKERAAGGKDGAVFAKVAVRSVAVKSGARDDEAKAEARPPSPKVEPPKVVPKAEPPKVVPKAEPPKVVPPPEPPEGEPPKAAPSRPSGRSPPVMQAAPAAARAPGKDERLPSEDEKALLEKWKKATHFEVLGVSQKASAADVKSAYFALARQHHPDTAIGDENADVLRKLKADLTSRLNEAYGVLGEDAPRAKYLENLKTGGADQVDIGPIMEAEETFMRSTILVKARKYAEAVVMLDKAILLNPQEGEFYAWRAYAKFVQAQDKRAEYDTAVAECLKALKMNEHCAPAHLFIGQMSKIIGDGARAEKSFRAVLKLEPDNVEAKRELRNSGKTG